MSNQKCLVYASEAQRLLNSALIYWLYDSISTSFFKKEVICKAFISPVPLLRCINAFEKSGLDPNVKKITIYHGHTSSRQFARALSKLFEVWEKFIPQVDTEPSILPSGQNYMSWLKKGGGKPHYKPVRILQQILEKNGGGFFSRAILHGSLATLDDAIGFSDMDLAFIVRSSVLKSPNHLMRLRNMAREILALTYAFDPFMHHGPYYIPEMDLACYPEATFPPILFFHGVDFINDQKLYYFPSPVSDITWQMIQMFGKFFENLTSSSCSIADSFDLEWILGSAMILPTLYLQKKTGEYRYKLETFSVARKDFSEEAWEPIQTASFLRESLGERPKPSCAFLSIARFFGAPEFLSCYYRRHPQSLRRAKEAEKILGRDFPVRVLKFINELKINLKKSNDHSYTL